MTIPKPTLHVSLLTLFLSFLFITAGSLTWFNYSENTKAASKIADQLLSEVCTDVTARIEYLFQSSIRMANEVAELPLLAEKPDFMSHPAQWLIAERLLARKHLYSAYIGYSDGDFFQIISLSNESLRTLLNVPDDARLAIRRVFSRPGDGRRVELWQFFDIERRLVASRGIGTSDFDPRERPWFTEAIGKEGIVHTPFYIFKSTGSLGMTFAHRFDGKVSGVFGVDVTLAGLSDYFANQKVGQNGYVFMFNKDLKITAHPDPNKTLALTETPEGRKYVRLTLNDLAEPLMSKLAEAVGQWDNSYRRLDISVDGARYLVHLAPMSDFMEGQILAVVAPLSDFTAHMDTTRQKSLIGAALIILIAIPVAAYNSRLMSVALNTLAKEADKIRHFKLDSTVNVTSHIAEIAELSMAVNAMRQSLNSFGRYVPKTLVQHLLLTSEVPVLGGERREATILFTDIADFTTISESMEAEDLMLALSEYLEEISSVVLQYEGTIDKFIGDSIMAFWNAPNPQEYHAEQACRAALAAREASTRLNKRWKEKGLPVMYTRFGLHTGSPIIGNVGSDDRMNYTAMGSDVNLASRLEGLNKFYGTQILASSTVVAQAGDAFSFRPVGMVMPKGTIASVQAYELMGSKECTIDCLEDPEALERFIIRWEEAYVAYHTRQFAKAAEIFEQCLAEKPDDGLAMTMLQRAREFIESPPDADWDGVDIFKTK